MARINHLSNSVTAAAESFSTTAGETGTDWSFPLLNDSSGLKTEINALDQAINSVKSSKINKDMEIALDNVNNAVKVLATTAMNTYRYILNFRNQPGGQGNPVLSMSEVSSIKEGVAARPRGQGYPPVSCWLNVEDINGKMVPIGPVNLSNTKFDAFIEQIETDFRAYRKENGVNVPVETSESMDSTPFDDKS